MRGAGAHSIAATLHDYVNGWGVVGPDAQPQSVEKEADERLEFGAVAGRDRHAGDDVAVAAPPAQQHRGGAVQGDAPVLEHPGAALAGETLTPLPGEVGVLHGRRRWRRFSRRERAVGGVEIGDEDVERPAVRGDVMQHEQQIGLFVTAREHLGRQQRGAEGELPLGTGGQYVARGDLAVPRVESGEIAPADHRTPAAGRCHHVPESPVAAHEKGSQGVLPVDNRSSGRSSSRGPLTRRTRPMVWTRMSCRAVVSHIRSWPNEGGCHCGAAMNRPRFA